MVYELKMADIHSIQRLLEQGWSQRRIARELDVHRDTVGRYARLAAAAVADSKPAKVATGSAAAADSEPAKVATGSVASRSACVPFRDVILAKLEVSLTAQRIYQDLRDDHGFSGRYGAVKRFVRQLGAATPLPFRRMECAPGEEGQVDFGEGGRTARVGRKRKVRPPLLRVVLSHSRKGYSETVETQAAEDFIRCLENAFWSFGGVPKTVVIDNLKAGVLQADWFDPTITPKFAAFAQHYGFVVLPAKPYTPRHKGKVEAGVKYAQENAVKGREFETLAEQNEFLRTWERTVADLRIHGTTRRQVRQHFEEVERPALLPLPAERFPYYEEGERTVHRDGHIAVEQSFYSVPPEFLGQKLWVRWDHHVVRIFDRRFEQIAMHARLAAGRFQTSAAHIPAEKISQVERGADYLLRRADKVGPESARWAQGLLATRKHQGLRVLVGFLSLVHKHEWKDLERACAVASSHGAYRLQSIRRLLKDAGGDERQIEFLEAHPLIRDPADYGRLIHDAFRYEPATQAGRSV